MDQASWARDLAEYLLAEPLPRRWAHTQGVGRKAESIADMLSSDADLLIAAAWLHDIGYCPDLAVVGFHPLDGARYLRDVHKADPRLCSLVAYHSCSEIEARHRGMADTLAAEFEPSSGVLADALAYCDMTTDPNGTPIDAKTRIAEVLEHYGDGHPVAVSVKEASPSLIEATSRIDRLIAARN
jgi:predicted hydrolase (HD superfamily)